MLEKGHALYLVYASQSCLPSANHLYALQVCLTFRRTSRHTSIMSLKTYIMTFKCLLAVENIITFKP
uniref:Uncharacterized protein n=1 Tax=Manihot esculenta TaxID=3983 RepID=A0A2C9W118_MANES